MNDGPYSIQEWERRTRESQRAADMRRLQKPRRIYPWVLATLAVLLLAAMVIANGTGLI